MSWRKTTVTHPQWAISSVSNLINGILSKDCPESWEGRTVLSWVLNDKALLFVCSPSQVLYPWESEHRKPISIVPWPEGSCTLGHMAILFSRPCRQNSTKHSEIFKKFIFFFLPGLRWRDQDGTGIGVGVRSYFPFIYVCFCYSLWF